MKCVNWPLRLLLPWFFLLAACCRLAVSFKIGLITPTPLQYHRTSPPLSLAALPTPRSLPSGLLSPAAGGTATLPDDDLSHLNSLKTTAPAVLLNSGPGTGKSMVLASRIAHILANNLSSPEGIVILSFATKDALAIKTSAVSILKRTNFFDDAATPQDIEAFKDRLWSGTFHSFSSAIIRRYGGDEYQSLRVISSVEQRDLLQSILSRVIATSTLSTDPILHPISPSLRAAASSALTNLGSLSSLTSCVSRALSFWKDANLPPSEHHIVPMVPPEALPVAAQLAPHYSQHLASARALDPSNLAHVASTILLTKPRALFELRSKLCQAFVDEFQDVSASQHALLKLVINGHPTPPPERSGKYKHPIAPANPPPAPLFDVPKLFAAGDADQSIYGWRGATPRENMDSFLSDFPQGVVVPLSTNYRLPHTILSAAQVFLASESDGVGDPSSLSSSSQLRNRGVRSYDVSPAARRGASVLLSEGVAVEDDDSSNRVIVRGAWDAKSESKFIASVILKRHRARKIAAGAEGRRKTMPWFDETLVGVMFRSSDQMATVVDALQAANIPFVMDGQGAGNAAAARNQKGNEGETRDVDATSTIPPLFARAEVKTALQILGACLDGEFASDRDFQSVLELFGGYVEDLPKSSSASRTSLFERSVAITGSKGGSAAGDAVAFLRKWNAVFTSPSYADSSRETRVAKVLSSFREAGLIGKSDVYNSTSSKLASERKESNLKALVSMISNSPSMGKFILEAAYGDISGASRSMEDQTKLSTTIPMTPVRVITMHGAKGKEFDDVYLAGWEEGVFPQKSNTSAEVDVNEERRLAYVALTRARQKVVITYAARRRLAGGTGGRLVEMEPSRFIAELRRGVGVNFKDGSAREAAQRDEISSIFDR